ncbi:MAG: uroporphyrinogen-III synthase [Thiohalobacteraceae bacterium]
MNSTANTERGPLAGRSILVTRPVHQAGELCRMIEVAGGRAVRFPVLDILPASDPTGVQAALARLGDYDLAIFVSTNAVSHTLAALTPRPWPPQVAVAAVGSATARALTAQGLEAIHPPHEFTSEALLALPALQQMAGRRVLILRGDGGREHLRAALLARGARVDYLEVYRRAQSAADPTALLAEWRRGIDAVLLASGETLRQLQAIIGTLGEPLLRTATLVVAHARTAELARSLGAGGTIVVAADATDAAMLAAVTRHLAAGPARDAHGT